jgi:hypothetical protein
MLKKMSRPRWRKGPPNKPGWWLVEESTTDTVAWLVTWDRDDDSNVPRYLRFSDGMSSEPVAVHHMASPVRRSYGPIPKPR